MKRATWIAMSAAAMGLAGCGERNDTTQDVTPTPDVAATATLPGTEAPATPGQQFANAAASSDQFEIETSRLAATKATSAKIKQFAEEMIAAHTDSTAKLNAAAASASPAITLAPQLTPAQQQTLTELGGKTGADFDTAYARAQVDAHQSTLDALKAYSATGDVPALKTFATELVPVVTAHLNMAKSL